MSHSTTGYIPKTRMAVGSISSANITGTTAGQLGHANGVELVPAFGSDKVLELVSAIIIMEAGATAYTGGGDTSINIGSGGAALTGVVSNANLIQSATDAIYHFVPLLLTE